MKWHTRLYILSRDNNIRPLKLWAMKQALKRVPPEKILALYHKQKKTLHQESA